MEHRLPAVLIQIHYHDRIGGVRQVMVDYSRAFSARAGSDAPNYWWCRRCGPQRHGAATVEDLPGIDYHTYTSRRTFQNAADRLIRSMLTRLRRFAGSGSVAVVGHNLALGKNPALAEAFARCARTLSSETRTFRFFSVLHDFAEQGRFDLLARRELLRKSGVDVDAALYGRGAPVHFIAPDRQVRVITGLSGRFLSILPNLVEKRRTAVPDLPSSTIRQLLKQCAALDGLVFNPDLPLYCYPSRMIYRKNILEALLLTTVMNEGSLVTGPSGLARADRRRMAAALALARRYGLSFAVDPGRLQRCTGETNSPAGESGNPFHLLLPEVDGAVTTSLAEGFGYALHEPWLYGTVVAGRCPEGIAPPAVTKGMAFYFRMPVPGSWVSLDRCYERYRAAVTGVFTGKPASKKSFLHRFIHEDTVDFGLLGTAQQVSIIRRIMQSDARRDELANLFNRYGCGLSETCSTETVRTAAAAITRKNGPAAFEASFVKILSRTGTPVEPAGWYRRITAWYMHQDRIRIITPAAGTD